MITDLTWIETMHAPRGTESTEMQHHLEALFAMCRKGACIPHAVPFPSRGIRLTSHNTDRTVTAPTGGHTCVLHDGTEWGFQSPCT
jgi:hypothetical protein